MLAVLTKSFAFTIEGKLLGVVPMVDSQVKTTSTGQAQAQKV